MQSGPIASAQLVAGSPASCGISAAPKNSRWMDWWRHFGGGLRQGSRKVRVPGSWPLPRTVGSTASGTISSQAEARRNRPGARARQGDTTPHLDAALDDDVGDDLLRLVFTACHPALSTEARSLSRSASWAV